MKQLTIRERKKSPQCKNGFLETTTAPLPRQRERIWHPGPLFLAKLRCYTGTEDMGHVGEKQELSVISKTLALSDDSSDPAWSLKSSLFFSSSLHIWTMDMVQKLGCKCSHMLDPSQLLLLKNNCTMTVLEGEKYFCYGHTFFFKTEKRHGTFCISHTLLDYKVNFSSKFLLFVYYTCIGVSPACTLCELPWGC